MARHFADTMREAVLRKCGDAESRMQRNNYLGAARHFRDEPELRVLVESIRRHKEYDIPVLIPLNTLKTAALSSGMVKERLTSGGLMSDALHALATAACSGDAKTRQLALGVMENLIPEGRKVDAGCAAKIAEILVPCLGAKDGKEAETTAMGIRVLRKVMECSEPSGCAHFEQVLEHLHSDDPKVLQTALDFASSYLLLGNQLSAGDAGRLRSLAAHADARIGTMANELLAFA